MLEVLSIMTTTATVLTVIVAILVVAIVEAGLAMSRGSDNDGVFLCKFGTLVDFQFYISP